MADSIGVSEILRVSLWTTGRLFGAKNTQPLGVSQLVYSSMQQSFWAMRLLDNQNSDIDVWADILSRDIRLENPDRERLSASLCPSWSLEHERYAVLPSRATG